MQRREESRAKRRAARRGEQREEQRCRGTKPQRRKTGRVTCGGENEKTLAGTLARSGPIEGAQERVVRVVTVATRTQ